jgi:hypothetical protein
MCCAAEFQKNTVFNNLLLLGSYYGVFSEKKKTWNRFDNGLIEKRGFAETSTQVN